MVLSQHLRLSLCMLGLAALLVSCNKSAPTVDPVAQAMAAYKAAVEPPIQESEEISQIFVQIVLEDKGNPDPDKAAKRIETEVLPRARKFLKAIQALDPQEQSLKDLHQFLIQVATLRVEGYQSIVDGYNQNDLGLFNEGHKKITESKIQENTFVDRAEQLMGPYGYRLTYYAPATVDLPIEP